MLLVGRALELIGFTGLRHAAAWMLSHPFLVLAWLFAAMMALAGFTFVIVVRAWASDKGQLDFEDTEEYLDRLLKESDDEGWTSRNDVSLQAASAELNPKLRDEAE